MLNNIHMKNYYLIVKPTAGQLSRPAMGHMPTTHTGTVVKASLMSEFPAGTEVMYEPPYDPLWFRDGHIVLSEGDVIAAIDPPSDTTS